MCAYLAPVYWLPTVQVPRTLGVPGPSSTLSDVLAAAGTGRGAALSLGPSLQLHLSASQLSSMQLGDVSFMDVLMGLPSQASG